MLLLGLSLLSGVLLERDVHTTAYRGWAGFSIDHSAPFGRRRPNRLLMTNDQSPVTDK